MIVDKSGHSIWTETPFWRRKRTIKGSWHAGMGAASKKGQRNAVVRVRCRRGRRTNATPERSFPSPPSLSSCHSIPANYRHGTRSFLRCVGSCVSPPPSLHVFTLSRGDENAGRARSDSSLSSSSGATPTSMSFRLPRLLQHGHAATMPINFKSALCSPFLPSLGGLRV